ncbi:hypothetical protein DRQ33_07450 [bacterium]|nr:MAG: hypothetical protein DRQ33_07450 [bacterium]
MSLRIPKFKNLCFEEFRGIWKIRNNFLITAQIKDCQPQTIEIERIEWISQIDTHFSYERRIVGTKGKT